MSRGQLHSLGFLAILGRGKRALSRRVFSLHVAYEVVVCSLGNDIEHAGSAVLMGSGALFRESGERDALRMVAFFGDALSFSCGTLFDILVPFSLSHLWG